MMALWSGFVLVLDTETMDSYLKSSFHREVVDIVIKHAGARAVGLGSSEMAFTPGIVRYSSRVFILLPGLRTEKYHPVKAMRGSKACFFTSSTK